jgi:glycine betaine/proline transport system ATP-binding protein
MDEAFSALDPLIRRDMQDELLDLQEKVQKTIVFISHDLDEALKLGDRIFLMKDGYIVQEGTAEEIMSDPANEYVRKFVEDVDRSKVITAETVMKNPKVVANLRTDGPKAALYKMKQEGISSLFVCQKNRVAGLVTADDAARSRKRGEKNLASILITDIQKVAPDTPADELIPLLVENSFPLAIVNEDDKLLGVVIKGSLLAGLSSDNGS